MSEQTNVAIDHAALWSSATTAVISLSLGDGRYDWMSCALGSALALMVAAFYRPALAAPDDHWGRCTVAGAFGAVGGFIVVMVLAWPVQVAVGTPAACYRSFRAGETDLDDCAGMAAYRWLGVVWLTAAVTLFCWHWVRIVRPLPRPAPPDMAAGASA
jgi:hypothetical protein